MFNYAYTFFLLGILALVVLPLSFLFKSEKPTSLNKEATTSNSFYLLYIPDLRKAIIVSSVILLARIIHHFSQMEWNFNILSTGGVNFSINITSFSPSVLTYNRIGWSVAN